MPWCEDSDESDLLNKTDENIYEPDEIFKCDWCEFTTLPNHGLKIHKSKMHQDKKNTHVFGGE